MKLDTRLLIELGLMGIISFSVARSCEKTPVPSIPHIITHYDTVYHAPEWLKDSEKVWKSRKATTDTVNIVITNTLIVKDTVYVGPDTSLRPAVYPLLEYHGGIRFGDTALVRTFSLRSGVQGVSRVFVPGILTDISADSTSVPRLTYAPFPKVPNPSLLYRLKYILYGAGLVTIIQGIK